ncbi:hypothetical protein ABT332_11045 [Saccharomonospora azurea]|uniref:hypothetical protein n=1 Tax=Saccharomonospora azurea TaxID=40988 RepID=UPI00331FB7D4
MPTWDQPVQTGAVGAAVGGGAAAAMGASLNTKAVDSMASEAKEMLKSAKSGGFRVSEDAAQPIIDVLVEMTDRVERLAQDLQIVGSQAPTLGGHDYGQRVAKHQYEAFWDGEGSAVEVLRQLRGVLGDAGEALEIAKKKYQESESDATSTFGGQS